MERKYQYLTCCVNIGQRDLEKLETMIDKGRQIKPDTFFKYVDFEELSKMMGYPESGNLTLKNDYAVSFYKSKWDKKICYYMNHSAIEYIFV